LRPPITFESRSITFRTFRKAFIWASEANTGVGAAGIMYQFNARKELDMTLGILQGIDQTCGEMKTNIVLI
jgi:hypothetical protein